MSKRKKTIEEVYQRACELKGVYKKDLKDLEWTSEWIDKFLAVDNQTAIVNLIKYVDITFEQFVIALEMNKRYDSRKLSEGCPATNPDVKYQIERLYPFTPEQESILKPYCEYEVFLNGLAVEPTYHKIVKALTEKWYLSWGYSEIKKAISKADLTQSEQFELLEKAIENGESYNLPHIVVGFLDNENLSPATVIRMCKLNLKNDLLQVCGYSDIDEKIIKHIATMDFTDEDKENLKKSSTYSAFDGAIRREDLEFDYYLEMINNDCNFTCSGIDELLSRFIKTGDMQNLQFNSDNELKLAQTKSWIAIHKLIELDNPNSYPETLICFAKTLFGSKAKNKHKNRNADDILREKIRRTVFSDEQFEELLEIANDFVELEIRRNSYIERIECDPYENEKYWSRAVNTGLILQDNLSFNRLYKVLKILIERKKEINKKVLDNVINSMELTKDQREILIGLGA